MFKLPRNLCINSPIAKLAFRLDCFFCPIPVLVCPNRVLSFPNRLKFNHVLNFNGRIRYEFFKFNLPSISDSSLFRSDCSLLADARVSLRPPLQSFENVNCGTHTLSSISTQTTTAPNRILPFIVVFYCWCFRFFLRLILSKNLYISYLNT